MSYTVTCPGCQNAFEVEEEDFDAIHEDGDPIECEECESWWNWDYDPDKPDGQEITLTTAVEFEDDEEEEDDEETFEESQEADGE